MSKLLTTGFPEIEHIDDVLSHIEGRKDIIVIDKGEYKVIDYVYNEPDTFDNVYRLECRGLKFDRNGNLIARPFHKFFNLEERPETRSSVLDFSKPHRVLDKLDGTMVHGCLLGDRFVLMTRKGITDHAERAYELLTEEQKFFLKFCCLSGQTPILEYVGPENQIVLYYEKPKLVWLACRRNIDGEYLESNGYEKTIFEQPHEYDYKDIEKMIRETREAKDIEGVVVVWEDGSRIKIKAQEYVEKHRVATGPFLEIHYLHAIFDNLIDDILPLKHGEFKERLVKYANEVNDVVNKYAQSVIHMVAGAAELDQKTFATVYLNNFSHTFRSMCFELRSKGGDARAIVIKHLKRLFRTQHDLEDQREYIGAKLDL